MALVHAINTIKQCQRLKAIKLTVAWSLNCLHVRVCVAMRCSGELTKDLTLKAKAKAKAKDLKFVLEDNLRPRTKATASPQVTGVNANVCPHNDCEDRRFSGSKFANLHLRPSQDQDARLLV